MSTILYRTHFKDLYQLAVLLTNLKIIVDQLLQKTYSLLFLLRYMENCFVIAFKITFFFIFEKKPPKYFPRSDKICSIRDNI